MSEMSDLYGLSHSPGHGMRLYVLNGCITDRYGSSLHSVAYNTATNASTINATPATDPITIAAISPLVRLPIFSLS